MSKCKTDLDDRLCRVEGAFYGLEVLVRELKDHLPKHEFAGLSHGISFWLGREIEALRSDLDEFKQEKG